MSSPSPLLLTYEPWPGVVTRTVIYQGKDDQGRDCYDAWVQYEAPLAYITIGGTTVAPVVTAPQRHGPVQPHPQPGAPALGPKPPL
jgi:hypothetical protein